MKRTHLKWLKRTTLGASFAFAQMFFAPDARAEETTQDAPTLTPEYPNEKPSWTKTPQSTSEPTNDTPKQPGWYGREVIGVTAAFDALSVIGVPVFFFAYNEFGAGLIIAGMAGRSLSGPIVHGVHGQSFVHGLKSYGLEVSGVLVGVGMAALMGNQCSSLVGADYHPAEPSYCRFSTAALLLTGVPLAISIAGTVLDATFLSDDQPNATKHAKLPAFAVSPYVIPSFRQDELTGKRALGMHFGLGGTF